MPFLRIFCSFSHPANFFSRDNTIEIFFNKQTTKFDFFRHEILEICNFFFCDLFLRPIDEIHSFINVYGLCGQSKNCQQTDFSLDRRSHAEGKIQVYFLDQLIKKKKLRSVDMFLRNLKIASSVLYDCFVFTY